MKLPEKHEANIARVFVDPHDEAVILDKPPLESDDTTDFVLDDLNLRPPCFVKKSPSRLKTTSKKELSKSRRTIINCSKLPIYPSSSPTKEISHLAIPLNQFNGKDQENSSAEESDESFVQIASLLANNPLKSARPMSPKIRIRSKKTSSQKESQNYSSLLACSGRSKTPFGFKDGLLRKRMSQPKLEITPLADKMIRPRIKYSENLAQLLGPSKGKLEPISTKHLTPRGNVQSPQVNKPLALKLSNGGVIPRIVIKPTGVIKSLPSGRIKLDNSNIRHKYSDN